MPDDYAEGLTRSVVNGRVTYYDRNFRQVNAPRYDWGWPFHKGRALVCADCKADPPDTDGQRAVSGGLWGYINGKGKEVVPVEYSQQEASRK